MHIFYTPEISGNTHQLSKEESMHCIRVLRLRVDETVCLVDGLGGYYLAIIREANQKACLLEVIETHKNYGKKPYTLSMAMGIIKNVDRFEWFVEKATEIGIDEITPLICKRSEKKHINIERIERIPTDQASGSYSPLSS